MQKNLAARLQGSENHDHYGHQDDHRDDRQDDVLQDPGEVLFDRASFTSGSAHESIPF